MTLRKYRQCDTDIQMCSRIVKDNRTEVRKDYYGTGNVLLEQRKACSAAM